MHRNQRPATIGELQTMMERFRSPHSLEAGLSITVRPTDVFLATYPKSGTTWMQQMAHAIRSRGSMEFDEICAVVPWLESALDMGQDPEADQQWAPRLFKVHLNGKAVPPGGRYVVVFRDPKAVAVSFHRFFDGTYFEAGAIDVETFAREWFMGGTVSGRYWSHLLSWWPRVGGSDTLALAYEDMVEDHRGTVALLADFLGFGGDDTLIDIVVERSTRHFMMEHARRFDDHLLFDAMHESWGLPAEGSAAKVKPRGAATADLSPELAADLDAIWQAEITRTLGFVTYEDLRLALRNRTA